METKTVLNPRKNYFTDSEISHIWAHQLRPQAHKAGANHCQFYFEGKTIYSYGGHFPIASLFGKKNEFVAITTRTYSNTTSGHISTVKSAVSHFAPENKIYCTNPQLAVSGLHKTNLENFEQAAKKAAEKLATAKKPSIYFAEIADQKAMFDKYCKAFKVKTKKKDFPNLHIQPTGEEIEKIKKQAAAEKERKAKAEAEAEAKRMIQLTYWLEGKKYSDVIPDGGGDRLIDPPNGLKHTYLRVIKNSIETSKGIELPVDAARRFYTWYIHTANTGGCKDCQKEILGYKVTQANAAGLIVGCHDITRSEIDRIANILNW